MRENINIRLIEYLRRQKFNIIFFGYYIIMSGIEKISKLIKKGNVQKLAESLQDPSLDINEIDPKSGKTLLQIAIQSQSQQAFDMILKTKGNKLDTLSKSGQSALQTAILMNSPLFVQQILRSKANFRIKNEQGCSAMYTAIKNQTSPEIISKLIHHNFDVNQVVPKYGSLLNLAIASDQFENFRILLSNPKIDLKQVDADENTCLLFAVKQKKGQFVQALLKKLTDPDQKIEMSEIDRQFYVNTGDQNGDTVLHIAARKDYQTILDILLKEGVKIGIDLETKNRQGKTYKDLHQQVVAAREKQKHESEYQQRKRTEQRIVKNKQKEQQRVRAAKQQEILLATQKKRKKEEQILEAKKRELSIQMERNRKIWILGIAFVVIVGVLYLLFLNASKSKPTPQF